MDETRYTTWGPVRGCCGHRHRTIRAASACCDRDHRDVVRGHGETAYSDREVRVLRDGDTLSHDVRRGPGEPEGVIRELGGWPISRETARAECARARIGEPVARDRIVPRDVWHFDEIDLDVRDENALPVKASEIAHRLDVLTELLIEAHALLAAIQEDRGRTLSELVDDPLVTDADLLERIERALRGETC